MMGVGTYLVGIAIAILSAVYIGKPFRRDAFDVDIIIEKWISKSRRESNYGLKLSEEDNQVDEEIDTPTDQGEVVPVVPINFCPHCGRRVEDDHRFCPGCGKPFGKEG